jgi:hypothetical protein
LNGLLFLSGLLLLAFVLTQLGHFAPRAPSETIAGAH